MCSCILHASYILLHWFIFAIEWWIEWQQLNRLPFLVLDRYNHSYWKSIACFHSSFANRIALITILGTRWLETYNFVAKYSSQPYRLIQNPKMALNCGRCSSLLDLLYADHLYWLGAWSKSLIQNWILGHISDLFGDIPLFHDSCLHDQPSVDKS